MLLVVEGIVMCFVLLIICVIGIANGPVGLVVFYEQEVKDRVVALGLTTRDRPPVSGKVFGRCLSS